MLSRLKLALMKKMMGDLKAVYQMRDFLSMRKKHKGGILIEFTFCIPLCIILLFFVNDHYRFYELKNKIKNSAYLAASMIQNLGNTRTDKQLTISDLARITFASGLNLFHTNTMFNPWPFGIYYYINYRYVKRLEVNSYQYLLFWVSSIGGTGPGNINKGINTSSTKTANQVRNMHPDLICHKDGDERLVVEVCYRRKSFDKSKLGFLLMVPQNSGTGSNLLQYQFVITPKPGLFPVVYK